MTKKPYKPTERFRANTKKLKAILKDIDEEMKKTHNVCTILLSIVINPEGSTMGYEYLKTFGDIDRNLQVVFIEWMKKLRALNPKKGERTH